MKSTNRIGRYMDDASPVFVHGGPSPEDCEAAVARATQRMRAEIWTGSVLAACLFAFLIGLCVGVSLW